MEKIDKTNNQIIFTFDEEKYSSDNLFSSVRHLFIYGEYEVSEEKIVQYKDTYYDSIDGDCIKSQITLRVRENHKGYLFIIKRPSGNDLGVQKREKIQGKIKNGDELKQLINSNFHDIFSKHIPQFLDKVFVPVVEILNARKEFTVTKNCESYVVRLDNYQFKLPSSNIKDKKEIELELKVLVPTSAEKANELRDHIKKIYPNLKYLHSSKFSRAEKFIDRYRTNIVHKAFKLLSDNALISLFLIVVGVLGSLASIAGFWFL
jgi:hypothetical protein